MIEIEEDVWRIVVLNMNVDNQSPLADMNLILQKLVDENDHILPRRGNDLLEVINVIGHLLEYLHVSLNNLYHHLPLPLLLPNMRITI